MPKKTKKNKKGFTLIELVGSIMILLVILLIAVPSINSIVLKGRSEVFDNNELSFEEAVKNYYTLNSDLLPTEDTVEISLGDAIASGVIEKIHVPGDLDQYCNEVTSKVYVVPTEEEEYEYFTYLDCYDYVSDFDSTAPDVQLVGDAIQMVQVGTSYVEQGATVAYEEAELLDGFENSPPGPLLNPTDESQALFDVNTVNSYNLDYEATDAYYNVGRATRVVTVWQPVNAAPNVTFTYNTSGVRTNHIVGLTITDVDLEDVWYQWTSSSTAPTSGDASWLIYDWNTSPDIVKNDGDGSFYLHVKAVDEATPTAHETISTSNELVFDNTGAVIDIDVDDQDVKESHSIDVDINESNLSSKKYQYTTSITEPADTDPGWIDFTASSNPTNFIKNDVTGNYYMHILVNETSGGWNIETSSAIKVDKEGPAFDISNTTGTSANHDVAVVNLVEPNLDKKYYMWTSTASTPASGDAGWVEYTDDVEISAAKIGANGDFYAHIKLTDLASHETIKSSTLMTFENNDPLIVLTPRSVAIQQSHIVDISITGITVTNKYYIWSTSVSDPVPSDSSWTSFSGDSLTTPSGITGTLYLHVKVDDASVSRFETSNGVELDNTPPNIGLTPTTGVQKEHTVDITITETNLSTKEYIWSTSSTTPSSGWTDLALLTEVTKDSVDGTWYLYVKAVDEVGQISTISATLEFDNTNPGMTFSKSPTSYTNGNVTITATGTDDNSGVYRIKKPDGTYGVGTSTTYSVSSDGTYTFIVYDNAGNSYTSQTSVSNIDKDDPYLSLSQSPTSETNGTVTISASYSDGDSGIDYISPGSSKTVSSNGSYSFTVYDNAGNSNTTSIYISNIDTTPPSVSISSTSSPITGSGTTTTSFSESSTKARSNSITVNDVSSASCSITSSQGGTTSCTTSTNTINVSVDGASPLSKAATFDSTCGYGESYPQYRCNEVDTEYYYEYYTYWHDPTDQPTYQYDEDGYTGTLDKDSWTVCDESQVQEWDGKGCNSWEVGDTQDLTTKYDASYSGTAYKYVYSYDVSINYNTSQPRYSVTVSFGDCSSSTFSVSGLTSLSCGSSSCSGYAYPGDSVSASCQDAAGNTGSDSESF